MGRKLLITGAILNFIIAAICIVSLFFLDHVSQIFGTEIHKIVFKLSFYAGRIIIALLFFFAGLYGLSGARIIRKLPLLKPVIGLIAIVFIARGVLGLAYELLSEEQLVSGFANSGIALFIGICYFSGMMWRWHGGGRSKYFSTK